MAALLQAKGLSTREETRRGAGGCPASAAHMHAGLDHGVFIPLKLMFPEADIPVLQVSLLSSLDPAKHMDIGRALAPLRNEGPAGPLHRCSSPAAQAC